MNTISRRFAIAAALVFMGFPQVSTAEETFTSKTILSWTTDQQETYLQTSIVMAGFLASRFSDKHAECIDKWYYDDIQKKHDYIREMLREHPTYHPTGVIIAVLEKVCGKF